MQLPVLRQFSSDHSLEEGGTEKFYFALVHGEVQVPSAPIERRGYPRAAWKVEPSGHGSRRRGRIHITMRFVKAQKRAFF